MEQTIFDEWRKYPKITRKLVVEKPDETQADILPVFFFLLFLPNTIILNNRGRGWDRKQPFL